MANKIYFICPDNLKPTGGLKQVYRQVDILNNNGFNACIIHKKKGFKSDWFQNKTKIEYNISIFRQLKFLIKSKKRNFKYKLKYLFDPVFDKYFRANITKLEKDGILVFPEIYGPFINQIEKDIKKVIFNQNCYYTYEHYPIHDGIIDCPYSDQNTLATIVASADARNYLEYIFPTNNLFRLRLGIDQNNFYYEPKKKKQIAFMTRKLEEDVVQVINILRQRNVLNGWELIPIENKTESEVAQIMRESLIFLSFNYREGFGLPPAEAMACGAIVIGYTGRGGNEYFKEEFSYAVQDQDVIGFANTVENVIKEYNADCEVFIKKGLLSSQFILNEYSLKNEEEDTVKIWTDILKAKQISNTKD